MHPLILYLCCALLLFNSNVSADEDNSPTVRTGAIDGDTYLAAQSIRMDANVDGDLVLAAADINVDGKVSGDLMAAGGKISITAQLADDVRAAGGDISLCSAVAGDAVLAGGEVDICSGSIIGNNAWLAGADVSVGGRVEGDLKIRANDVTLSGVFLKNVDISAKSIEVLENTEIMGDLIYRSPNPAAIHDAATILGEEDYTIADTMFGDQNSGSIFIFGLGVFLTMVLSTLLTGFTLSSLLPKTYDNTSHTIRKQFLPSIATGLLVAFITPFALILLAITIVAMPLAWIGLLLYLLVLATGGYAGLLFIADAVHKPLKQNFENTRLSKLLSILIAVLVLLVVGFIPLIGKAVLLIMYLVGVGALCLCLIKLYKQRKQSLSQLEGSIHEAL